jgi:hypothetical protein
MTTAYQLSKPSISWIVVGQPTPSAQNITDSRYHRLPRGKFGVIFLIQAFIVTIDCVCCTVVHG